MRAVAAAESGSEAEVERAFCPDRDEAEVAASSTAEEPAVSSKKLKKQKREERKAERAAKAAAQMKAAAAGSSPGVAGMPEEQAVDFAAMAAAGQAKAEKTVDDGSGTLQVWRVEDFKKVEVPKEM